MSDDAMERLTGLGLILPPPPAPMGAYRAVIEAGSTLHVSMQGPVDGNRLTHRGLLGAELTVEEGVEAAKQSALNALAQIDAYLGGFTRIKQIVRLEGCVACTDDFLKHPAVLDGASDLLASVFGDRAGHIRLVCGVRNLPGNVPVAVALMAEIHPA